jgi:hypothetical protein
VHLIWLFGPWWSWSVGFVAKTWGKNNIQVSFSDF